MKKWFMLVALVFVMVVAGEAWGIRAVSAAAKPRTLRLMTGDEVLTLDRARSAAVQGEPVWENVMEPLVRFGKAGEPVFVLATRWEPSTDSKKWRFYLRRGVKFHNGADFTARDVVETAKYISELKAESAIYGHLPIKEAVAIDDYTVDLIFEKPQPLLPVTIRYLMIYPTAIARDNRKMATTSTIGTGPYRFVEWKRGQHIRLTKFEGYWGPKPQIDDVLITFRGEVGVRLAALIAGEVDWIEIGPEQASQSPKVVQMASPLTTWLRFDEYIRKELGGVSILADKRLRLAIDYAIDRKVLVGLYNGYATPSLGQFASPGDFGFDQNLKSRPYDLERAKALVKEAGAVGKTVTFVGITGRWAKAREVSEAIAFMIEQTGLKVNLMITSEAENYRRVVGENRKNIVDIVLGFSDAVLEVETRFPYIFVEGGRFCATLDPQTEGRYKAVAAETEYAKRGAKVASAWAYVYEQAHYAPLIKPAWIWGLSRNLEWEPPLTGVPYLPSMRFTD